MQAPKWFLVTLVLGVLLVAVSLILPWLYGPRSAWTEEQAQQHAQTAAKLHSLAHRRGQSEDARRVGKPGITPPPLHNHNHDEGPPPSDAQLAEAREQFDRSEAQLQQARRSGQTTAAVLRTVGVLCVLGGGGGYLLLRRMGP